MNQRREPDGAEVSGAACKLSGQVLMWEFECNNCRAKFETPVPRGPREERAIKCPECSSKDIKRLNEGNLSLTACGG